MKQRPVDSRVFTEGAGLSRLRNTNVPDHCPDEETLAAFADGNLLPEEIARIEEHLAQCAKCSSSVAFVMKLKDKEDQV